MHQRLFSAVNLGHPLKGSVEPNLMRRMREKMMRVLILAAGLALTGCASSGVNLPGINLPGPLGSSAVEGQITQCDSAGGTEALIAFPSDWKTRVGRAETEDELLGGPVTSVATAGDAQPVGGVSFDYPSAALSPPKEGLCEVKFDLSRRGEPSRVVSACSDPVFAEGAERAVLQARFEPVRVNGAIARGVNMLYLMKFCLADDVAG